jgi:hypothetical protein
LPPHRESESVQAIVVDKVLHLVDACLSGVGNT